MGRQLTSYFMLPFVFLSILSYVSCYSSHRRTPTSPVNTYAVLVAGTYRWFNYRHQANVAHAYRVLRSHGVPQENIIVMSVDDAVNDDDNPTKGKLFNSPDGADVYSGLKVDYSVDQVTLKNFLEVLKGSTNSSLPKVLKSGPKDSVFIYISSVGSTGIVGLPKDILTSSVLKEALVGMKNDQKFAQLTVYLDSDYSSTMFDSVLPSNISVYAVSSAAFDQATVASHCNTPLAPYTCLSSSYSTAWLSDAGSKLSLNSESLSEQFDVINKAIEDSSPPSPLTPGQFGDLSLVSLAISKFMGSSFSQFAENPTIISDQFSSFDVPLEMAKLKYSYKKYSQEVQDIINARNSTKRAFYHLINDMCWNGYCKNATETVEARPELFNHEIYSRIVTMFHKECLDISRASWVMTKMHAFADIVNQSEAILTTKLDSFLASLYQACRRRIINQRHEDTI